MIWGAHQADGRIAANNARKIRAALGLEINARQVYDRYLETQPTVSDNIAQDRAKARAWAMLNVGLNEDALYQVLSRLWAEGVVTGYAAAEELIAQLERRRSRKIAKENIYIDWANWKPGDLAAAALVRPKGALARLLEQAAVSIRSLAKETYNELGTAIADSLAVGLSPERAAKLINDKIRNPKRSLTIAITELNRAMSAAAIERYRQAEIEYMEWSVSDPCPICAQNAGQVVQMGGTFNSGSTQPPAHPNCRCVLLPVIPEYDDNGVIDVAPKTAKITAQDLARLDAALENIEIEWVNL
jgi:SPP1 gp7 family putative phage head morphogenesis protein